MAICTLQNVFETARGHLHDTQVTGGETFQNSILQVQFNEPYRDMFRCLMGASKRVQRIVYVVLPANTTVLNPAAPPFLITDMAEPEMVEQRPATSAVAIASVDAGTPITVTTVAPHGFGGPGTIIAGQISGVSGTTAPWGNWFGTVTGASTFTLNGSMSDGTAGTGGSFYGASQQQFTEVLPIDLAQGGLDGTTSTCLDYYLWINEQMQFRGASGNVQLRITYYASGNPPTNSATNINIDDCLDFLATATAANAANSVGWWSMSDRLRERAYGDGGPQCTGGLLGKFLNIQVLALQRGPIRRQLPFRDKRSRFGNFPLG